MVRIKNRYLLVNILYPELPNPISSSTASLPSSKTTALPDVITFHQPTTSGLTAKGLERGIKSEIEVLFGDYGYGAIRGSINVKYLSTATSTVIIKVARDHYKLAWTALTFMTHVPGVRDARKCVFRVVKVSGTIRKAQEEVVRRARGLMLAAQREQSGKSDMTLSGIFGRAEDEGGDVANEVRMVDRSDSEEEEDSDK